MAACGVVNTCRGANDVFKPVRAEFASANGEDTLLGDIDCRTGVDGAVVGRCLIPESTIDPGMAQPTNDCWNGAVVGRTGSSEETAAALQRMEDPAATSFKSKKETVGVMGVFCEGTGDARLRMGARQGVEICCNLATNGDSASFSAGIGDTDGLCTCELVDGSCECDLVRTGEVPTL